MAENLTNIGALIPISENNGKRAVSARDLYNFLGCSERFQSWFDRQLQYGFVEDLDYTSVKTFTVVGNGAERTIDDYAMTIDMAKEVSMIQKNERGKDARRYFIEREKELQSIKNSSIESRKIGLREKMDWISFTKEILSLNDNSVLMLMHQVADPLGLPVPDYVDSKGILKSATELLKARNCGLSAQGFNLRAIEKGILREIERNTSKGKKKLFKCITEKGLTYGENQVNPNNPKETQPLWYESKFDELLAVLDIKVGRAAV